MKNIKVNDMTCMNCVNKINMKLTMNKINAKIDLPTHSVSVKDNELEKAIELIKEVGYTPEV